MKKTLVIALVSSMLTNACKKIETVATVETGDNTEIIEVALAKGSSYSYTLAESSTDVAIVTDAQNASASKISIVPGVDSVTVYNYVPSSTFTGTDAVTILIAPNCGQSSAGTCQTIQNNACGNHGNAQGACGGTSNKIHHGHKHGHKHGAGTCNANSTGSTSKQITFKFTVNDNSN